MNNVKERGLRASRAAARRAAEEESKKPQRFRVLVAVQRPRYRSRIERALAAYDWEFRCLLNNEDPIGLINQKAPDILVIAGDFGRCKDFAFLKASQRFRPAGLKIVGIFESAAEAEAAASLCDYAISPSWKSIEARDLFAEIYKAMRGELPVLRPIIKE
jgi:DNA-binding NtrC family response regulator